MAEPVVALQLFTVRKLLAEDYVETLKEVRQIGYDHVQLTGSLPYEAEQMHEVLDAIGLGVCGIHVSGTALREEPEHWADYAHTVGTKDLVWPFMPEQMRRTRADWTETAKMMDRLGARYRELGIRFSYHNHSFEFERFDGDYGLDLLYANSSPDNLNAELDTYWIKHGGEDPVDYIRRYAGRQAILHLKDMADDAERSFAEVGHGILDWDAIHGAATDAGVEAYAVEQDRCKGDPLESARMSFEFLQQLLGL